MRGTSASDLLLFAFFVSLAGSISAAQIALTLLVLAALPELWRRRAALPGLPLLGPFGALAGATLLAALRSGAVGWSLWESKDLLLIAAFYLVLFLVRDAEQATWLVAAFLVAVGLMALYGLGQVWLCHARPAALEGAWLERVCRTTWIFRAKGPFSIYMTFAGVLGIALLLLLAQLAYRPWRQVWWMAPAGLVGLVTLALTYSRNAWLGLAAGALGLFAARRARPILLVAAGLVGLLLLLPGPFQARVRSIADPADPTVRERWLMWQSGLAILRDHPLIGIGPGQVSALYPAYRHPEATKASTGHLHNSPLQVAVERGLLGFAAWGWLWIAYFRRAWRAARGLAPSRGRERALAWGGLIAAVGFLVAGLFEYNFGDSEVLMLAYTVMALPFIAVREAPPAPAEAVGTDAR